MDNSREASFAAIEKELGCSFAGEIKSGGNYTPVVQHGDTVYISGQVPRVGDTVVVTGRVGKDVALADAQKAARICAMRALALLKRHLGSLDRIKTILRVTVYVQSAEDFSQQSEVGNGASEVFFSVLGQAGVHARTSIGVFQLPRNASVEVDCIAATEV